jgi:DNA repair protein RadC
MRSADSACRMNFHGIKLLDHVVIGDGRYVSFADEGLL